MVSPWPAQSPVLVDAAASIAVYSLPLASDHRGATTASPATCVPDVSVVMLFILWSERRLALLLQRLEALSHLQCRTHKWRSDGLLHAWTTVRHHAGRNAKVSAKDKGSKKRESRENETAKGGIDRENLPVRLRWTKRVQGNRVRQAWRASGGWTSQPNIDESGNEPKTGILLRIALVAVKREEWV